MKQGRLIELALLGLFILVTACQKKITNQIENQVFNEVKNRNR